MSRIKPGSFYTEILEDVRLAEDRWFLSYLTEKIQGGPMTDSRTQMMCGSCGSLGLITQAERYSVACAQCSCYGNWQPYRPPQDHDYSYDIQGIKNELGLFRTELSNARNDAAAYQRIHIQTLQLRDTRRTMNQQEFLDAHKVPAQYVLERWVELDQQSLTTLKCNFNISEVKFKDDFHRVWTLLERLAVPPHIWVDRYGERTYISQLPNQHIIQILKLAPTFHRESLVESVARDIRLQAVVREAVRRKIPLTKPFQEAWSRVLTSPSVHSHPSKEIIMDTPTKSAEPTVTEAIKNTGGEMKDALVQGAQMALVGKANRETINLFLSKHGDKVPEWFKTEEGKKSLELVLPGLVLLGLNLYPTAQIPLRDQVSSMAWLGVSEAGRGGASIALDMAFEFLMPLFSAYGQAAQLSQQEPTTVDFQAEKEKVAAQAR